MSVYYHYCNIDAFLNIIRNKILWLSDINKSNDPWEGGKVFQDIFDYYSFNCIDNDQYDYKELSRIMDRVMNYDCEMRLYNNFHAYAICFSKNGDLLSQWRGYTKDAAGISIGFDERLLERWSYSYKGKKIAEYKKIQYGEKEEDIIDVINKLLELGKDLNFYGDPSDIERFSHPFYQYLENRAIEGYFVKDRGFREEREKRILYREYFRSEDTHQLNFWKYSSSTEVNNHIAEFSLSDVKYHCWPTGFKKYYELSFERVSDSLIKEIVIGPRCELHTEDVEELLLREGYLKKGKKRISVKRSEIIIR